MKTIKNLLIAVLAVILFSFVSESRAEVSKEKRAEIQKMLQLTGMEKLMGQMKEQMMSSLRRQMPNVPEEFWTKFEAKMDMHELIEKIIPIYDKYYTVEDLKAVNAFYSSPAGQKVLSTLPQVMKESMQIGQEWGERIGKEAAAEAEMEMKKK